MMVFTEIRDHNNAVYLLSSSMVENFRTKLILVPMEIANSESSIGIIFLCVKFKLSVMCVHDAKKYYLQLVVPCHTT